MTPVAIVGLAAIVVAMIVAIDAFVLRPRRALPGEIELSCLRADVATVADARALYRQGRLSPEVWSRVQAWAASRAAELEAVSR